MPSKLGNCVIISGETSVAPYADTMKIGVFLRNTWAGGFCCGELILAALPLRKPPNGVFVEGGSAMSNKGIDVDSAAMSVASYFHVSGTCKKH